jgi:hypothetical protein
MCIRISSVLLFQRWIGKSIIVYEKHKDQNQAQAGAALLLRVWLRWNNAAPSGPCPTAWTDCKKGIVKNYGTGRKSSEIGFSMLQNFHPVTSLTDDLKGQSHEKVCEIMT